MKNLRSLEVLFTPADFGALRQRDLSHATCVVFDILRATSTMLTALANGAEAIVPVSEISEALALRQRRPAVLLAGEREGLRIRAAQTGNVDFDLGNSPREFTAERVRGRTVVMTTTNGTRALQACHGAKHTFLGSFLGLQALVDFLRFMDGTQLILVCAGTHEEAAYEDTLAAGAVCEALWTDLSQTKVTDAAAIARHIYREHAHDLVGAMKLSHNGRRLLDMPDLRDDVAFCLRRDVLNIVAGMNSQGEVRRW